jgi:hypothetical protein
VSDSEKKRPMEPVGYPCRCGLNLATEPGGLCPICADLYDHRHSEAALAPPEPPRPSHVRVLVDCAPTVAWKAGDIAPIADPDCVISTHVYIERHPDAESPWTVHLTPGEWEPVEPVPSTPPSQAPTPRGDVAAAMAYALALRGLPHDEQMSIIGEADRFLDACEESDAASPPVPSATVTNELSDEQLGRVIADAWGLAGRGGWTDVAAAVRAALSGETDR